MPNKTKQTNKPKLTKSKPKPKIKTRRIVSRNRYLKSSTLQSVQRGLGKGKASLIEDQGYYQHYAHCRLDPFNSTGTEGIPDSSGNRTVVVDHRGFTDFVCTSAGTLQLKTMAAFPFGLLAKHGTTGASFTANGIPFATSAIGTNYNVGWIPALTYSEYTTQAATSITGATIPYVADPFTAGRFRIVTQAFRIYYTGQAQVCAGMISVTSDSFTIDQASSMSQTALTGYSYSSTGVETAYTLSSGTALVRRIAIGTNPSVIVQSTVMQRPEQGANILIKHIAPEYDWQPMPEYGTVLVSGQQPTYMYMAYCTASAPLGSFPGQLGIDPGWESVQINISGAPGLSFRVESIMCVEYEPLPNSNVARFAKMVPTSNPKIVSDIDQLSKTIPSAIPLNNTFAPWLSRAYKIIRATLPVAASYFGPIGAAVGSVVQALPQEM